MNIAHGSRSYHAGRHHGRLVRVTADVAFDLPLDHGRCVGIRLPELAVQIDELADSLLPAEKAFASQLVEARRRSWVGGRVAMREALLRSAIDAPAVLADPRGAPRLPAGVSGSISHKTKWAIALVAHESVARLGVDIEDDVVRSLDISRRVLRADELAALASLAPEALAREVLLRFSAKEALYKALDPFVQRYVGFHEVSVSPEAGGTARVALHFSDGGAPFAAEVRWIRRESLVITTARVQPV
jgi:enterobactin synthetase component D